MFEYDSKNNLLTIQKVPVPRVNKNVMRDIQESYYDYINKTVYEDIKYLEECLRKVQNLSEIELTVKVGSVIRQDYMRNQVKNSNIYIPVTIQPVLQGYQVGPSIELLRIPYMDDYGKINVKGSSKVVLTLQRTSEDVSYDLKESKFNISMPYANMTFTAGPKDIVLKHGKGKISIIQIIGSMCAADNIDLKVSDYFSSTYLRNIKYNNEFIDNQMMGDRTENVRVLSALKSDQYRLGKTRESLNEIFQLDVAVGEILSREVLHYKRGTSITTEMVNELKRNFINEVYVVDFASLGEGLLLGKDSYIFCDLIKEGTPYVTEFSTLGVDMTYVRDGVFVQDVALEEPLALYPGTVLSPDMVVLLNTLDIKTVHCATHANGPEKVYSLEREICGNYTVQRKFVGQPRNASESADDWIYYYKNPGLVNTAQDFLTAHDIIAIASAMGQVYTTGYTSILNRDTAYLKKVFMIGDVFSECFRKTVPTYITKYKRVLSEKMTDPEATDLFAGFTKQWLSYMNKQRFLAAVDSINLSSEIAQVTRVTTLVESSASVKDVMRRISMLYLGRLCPFDTPAGKKLGLVNSKALGAKVKDNLILTPYRKVIRTANGIRISKTIEYLSVKQELKVKVCDILALVPDGQDGYKNTKINARVPNPNKYDDEKLIITTINAWDMAGGYVLADPEQILSPTAGLMPFACSNNAIRITYGLKQINQAIYLHNSEIPRVMTQGYKDMFNYSRQIYAPATGTVTYADKDYIRIKDRQGVEHKVFVRSPITEGQLDVIIVLNVSTGDTVIEDDVLAELVVNPQFFVVRAPYSGRIMNIDGDSITIERKKHEGNQSFVYLDDDGEYVDSIRTSDCRIMGQSAIFLNFEVSEGDVVKKGDILATTAMSRKGIFSPSRSALCAYIFEGYNYEDGIAVSERFSHNYTSLIAHSVKKEINAKNEPNVVPGGLSGFNYRSSGDVIAYYEKRASKDAPENTPLVKRAIRADHKHQGIPFERTVTVTPSKNKEYSYALLGFNKLNVGDKMAGRHGNKGVTSAILPNSSMGMLPNGMFVDCMLNPCGVPSRMNLGQMWEGHLGFICLVLDIYTSSEPYNGASPEDITLLMDYAYTLANTDGLLGNLPAFNSLVHADKYKQLPEQLHSHCWENLANIVKWKGCFDKKGDCQLWDPITETYFNGKVTLAYSYMLKLMQEADEKINFRAGLLSEQYSRTTSQPQVGATSAKGQRTGEMELMAYAAYGANALITEMLNEKCDNVGAKYNMYVDALGENFPKVPEKFCTPRATETLIYMLEAMGIKAEVTSDIAVTGTDDAMRKHTYNLLRLVTTKMNALTEAGDNTTRVKVLDINAIED